MTDTPDTARAILDAMVASALRRESERRARRAKRTDVLRGIDPKTFHRARETGWLSRADFSYLLQQCEDDQRATFQARWRAFRERHQAYKLEARYRHSVENLRLAQILRWEHGDANYWDNVARTLFAQVTILPWPPQPEQISRPLDDLVEKGRQIVGEERALKNALILIRATALRSSLDRADERLMLLSILCAALKIAGLLGHRQAHRFLRTILEDLHRRYPSDLQIERVLLCCAAIEVSHSSNRTPTRLRQAMEFHAQEAVLAEKCIRDGRFAQDWPVLYREVRGPAWNLMNVRLDAGLGVALAGHFFQQHLEWQVITENHLPTGFRLAENPNLAIETDAYNVRFRAGVMLDRPDRSRACAGAEPEAALIEIDSVLDSPSMKPYLNQLTVGHLLGLRAEALLCLYSEHRTSTRLDAYVHCRDAARNAYASVHDEANSQIWSVRLRTLEQSLGL